MNTPGAQSQPAPRTSIHDVRVDDHVTHIAIVGDLGIDGCQAIELAFSTSTAARRRPVVIDVRGVTFVSSYGLGVLVACAKACAVRHVGFVLVGTPPKVAETIRLSRLDGVLPTVATEAEAYARLGIG
ncbi:MAG: STAS domain-containing protein [Phycisphaerae bacterium]|nr:STAS domain-containing protein [Phycisphaerae bacterium]